MTAWAGKENRLMEFIDYLLEIQDAGSQIQT